MNKGAQNWEIGAQKGRAMQSSRAAERIDDLRRIFEVIAFKHRPKTREEFARVLNELECPTPSGRARWSGNLVNQYMRRLRQTPKGLLAQFPERSGIAKGFRPEVYAAHRAEIQRLNTPSDNNGVWRSALDVDPARGAGVFHETYGHGDFIERTSLTKLLCTFISRDRRGSPCLVDHECPPSELLVFTFHLSVEERRVQAVEFWERLIAKEEESYRPLIDGWHM